MAYIVGNVDKQAKSNGVWKKYRGSKFLIASLSSFKFQSLFASLQKPHQRAIEKNTLDPETGLDILCQALAKTILLDWKKLKDISGDRVEYSAKTAASMLKDDEDLRAFVQEIGQDVSNYEFSSKELEEND